eukprot:gene22072-28167_t
MFNNEAIRARENKTKMMSIMMQIEPRSRIDLLDDSQRMFIKDAPLLRQCRRGLKEFHFWLFSDKLLYGQAVPFAKDIFILNREIPLSRCFVKLFDSLYDSDRTFMVESPAKSFIVRTKNEAERNEWLKAIKDAIQKQRERISHQRGSVAPLWIPDATSTQCQKCHDKFTLLNRRHHCRNCGGIVCDTCSNQRILVSHVDEKKEVRVCTQCHYLLSSTVGSGKQTPNGSSSGSGKLTDASAPQQATLGADDYYNSDEEEEGEGVEGSSRGAVNEDQLNDFNENYEELGETLRARASTGSSSLNSPTNPGRAPPSKRPSVFGGQVSTLINDMTKILTPRNRSTINLGSSSSTSTTPFSRDNGGTSPMRSPNGRDLPPSPFGSSGSDGSAKTSRKENPMVQSLKRNPLFNAGAENSARAESGASVADRSSPSGDAPLKPPKPVSSPRAPRRTNLLLRPEDMPKDTSENS